MSFKFYDPGRLVDDELELELVEKIPGNPEKDCVPAYRFWMRLPGHRGPVGIVELRVGDTEHLRQYAGHLGYRVTPSHRGNRYAVRACRLILPLARRHGLRELWITCNPDNLASRRTCELLGAELVEIVDVPADDEIYERGDRQKCRYLLSFRIANLLVTTQVPGTYG